MKKEPTKKNRKYKYWSVLATCHVARFQRPGLR